MGDGDIASNTRNMRLDADRYAREIADALAGKEPIANRIASIEDEITTHKKEEVLDPTSNNLYRQNDYAQTVVKATLENLQEQGLLPDLRLQVGSALIGNGHHRESDLRNTAYNLTAGEYDDQGVFRRRPLEGGIVNDILNNYKDIEATRREPTFLGMGQKAGIDDSRLQQSAKNQSDQFNSGIMLQQYGTKEKFNAIASPKGCLIEHDLDSLLNSYDPQGTSGDQLKALKFMKDNFSKMSAEDPDSGERQITFDSMMDFAKKKGVTGPAMVDANSLRSKNDNMWDLAINANSDPGEIDPYTEQTDRHHKPTDKQDHKNAEFIDGTKRKYEFKDIDEKGVPKVFKTTASDGTSAVWTHKFGDTWTNRGGRVFHGTIQRTNDDWVMTSYDDGTVTTLHKDGTKTSDKGGLRTTTLSDGEQYVTPIDQARGAHIANVYAKNHVVSAIRLSLDAANVKQQHDEKLGHYAVIKPQTPGVTAVEDGDVVFSSNAAGNVDQSKNLSESEQRLLLQMTNLARKEHGNDNLVVVRSFDRQNNAYRFEIYAGLTDASVTYGTKIKAGDFLGRPSQDGNFDLMMRNLKLDGNSIEVHGSSADDDKETSQTKTNAKAHPHKKK